MAEFSIQQAAFTGFNVVREHPGYLAIWAALALVLSVACTGLLVVFAGPEFTRLQQLGSSNSPGPVAALRAVTGLLPIYAFLTPLVLVFYGILYAAMNRSVLRPRDAGWGYLRFGRDELRQISLMIVFFLTMVGVYVASIAVSVVIGLLIETVTRVTPVFIGIVSAFIVTTVFVFVLVRLSLASALTFYTGQVNLFGSWVLTRRRFWPICATYLLTFALAAIVLLLTYLMILAATAVATGGNMFALLAPPDTRSLASYFNTAHIVQLVLGAGVSALVWPVMLTPPAAIYRDLTAPTMKSTPIGQVFS